MDRDDGERDTAGHRSRPPPEPRQDGRADPPELPSETLLAGRREVLIRHGADRYRLRVTSSNKLILTK